MQFILPDGTKRFWPAGVPRAAVWWRTAAEIVAIAAEIEEHLSRLISASVAPNTADVAACGRAAQDGGAEGAGNVGLHAELVLVFEEHHRAGRLSALLECVVQVAPEGA